MKTKLAAALLASGTFVWAAPAQAKELSAFKVCGPSGCTSVTDRTLLNNLILSFEGQGEAVHVSTPAPAQFLRLSFPIGVGAQGVLLENGIDAIRISGSGETDPPVRDTRVSDVDVNRYGSLGRGVIYIASNLDFADMNANADGQCR